jgi:glycosyltransferase involved in cell wall biosynthesis
MFVGNSPKSVFLRWFAAVIMQRLHRVCLINVFVSHALKASYGNAKRISWIINDSRLMKHNIVSPLTLRRPLHSPPRVLFAGRLNPEKGLSTLIDAIAQLDVPVELFIAGGGPEMPKIQLEAQKAGIADSVHFLGVVPWGERLFSVMQDADLLVLPSVSEGLPLVLLEAMANGLVPIASAVGGIPEIVKDGVNGLLVAPSNAAQLCQTITRLLKDDKLRAQMQLAGLPVAEENTIEKQRCRMFRDLGKLVQAREAR